MGQVLNVRLINLFSLLRKHLPDADVNDPRVRQRSLDEQNGMAELTFDFRIRTGSTILLGKEFGLDRVLSGG